MTAPRRTCTRILVTIEITDPETVDAYKDVDDALVFDDLRDGTLMQMAALVSRENKEIERDNESHRNADAVEPLVRLRNSLTVLGITGDSLFARIREDLERGLVNSARMHLNFVDVMVEPNGKDHA